MIEEIIKNVIKSNLVFLIKPIGQEIYQIIANRILEYQITEYNRNLYTKTFLHRSKPVKLHDIYFPLSLSQGYSGNIEVSSIKNLFNFGNHISIIGYAGSGKSMLIKYLFIKSIEEKFKIPIKIELRYLNDYKSGIKDFIYNEIFKFNEFAIEDRIIDRLLKSGKFVFFLDGFDEIKRQKISLINKEIDDFSKKYNKNSYLFTSRPHVDIELHNAFINYRLEKLSIEEAVKFILKQLLNKEIESKIIKSVENIPNEDIRSFLSNPLLLSMYILTYQTYSKVPDKKCIFYRQVFDTLFDTHDSLSKLAFEREKRSKLSKDKIEKTLKGFSFISYFGNKFLFDANYYDQKIDLIKSKTDLNFENDKLLYDLLVSIAIFVKDGYEYSYAHRSLQEYFAALYISDLTIENKERFYNKLINQIFEKKQRITEFFNLFSLLLEIDNIYLLKLFCLPILKVYQRISLEMLNKNLSEVNKVLPSEKIMSPIFELILGKQIKNIEYQLNNVSCLKSITIFVEGSSISVQSLFKQYITNFEKKIDENYEYEKFIFSLM